MHPTWHRCWGQKPQSQGGAVKFCIKGIHQALGRRERRGVRGSGRDQGAAFLERAGKSRMPRDGLGLMQGGESRARRSHRLWTTLSIKRRAMVMRGGLTMGSNQG